MKQQRMTHLCVAAAIAVATMVALQAQENVTTGFVEDTQGANVIGTFVGSLKLNWR